MIVKQFTDAWEQLDNALANATYEPEAKLMQRALARKRAKLPPTVKLDKQMEDAMKACLLDSEPDAEEIAQREKEALEKYGSIFSE